MRIDDSQFADLGIGALTVGPGMKLIVSDPDPNVGNVTVGNVGAGTLNIIGGGSVESTEGIIGEVVNAVGAVNITGATSSWTVTDQLHIGFRGNASGQLTLRNGSTATAHLIAIGQDDSANGTVTVDGINSTLRSNTSLGAGGFTSQNGFSGVPGGTGVLTVGNGGHVEVANTLPEPASVMLLAAGGLLMWRKKRQSTDGQLSYIHCRYQQVKRLP